MLEKDRFEAFSDGVFAVIITIMVLELRAPQGPRWADLGPVFPTFVAYVLSFINVGIYWNNHHHMLRAAVGIDGTSMWLNLHLLFWLSLIPFTTNWVGAYHTDAIPTAVYGGVLFCAGGAYGVLARALIRVNGRDSALARAMRAGRKEIASQVLYALGIAAAFVAPAVSDVLYFAVAAIWFIPDRRVERELSSVR